ncbi:GNAT family N-acetyltransferase [Streptomyces sp. GS7]|uniref:GNAT family N-acetyltransferase n=1 Tax=Streptomyces sp. GS7 TaxID=2692234 RepID=UPI001F3EF68E|nr:GNAT family N-acetyltransferase [Streptomyces sp. GS7]
MNTGTAQQLPDLARAWVAGWTVSRRTPPPVEETWGLRVDVGLPNHTTRHVLIDTDEVTVRTVACSTGAPGTRIKALMPLETLVSWIGAAWVPDSQNPAFLLAADLQPGTEQPPCGYRVTTETHEAVTCVRVLSHDGYPAARGQIAATGETAVVDRVKTDPAHRRRGLGTLVMHTLANAATARGATAGVLAASMDGRALYEALGWPFSLRSPE